MIGFLDYLIWTTLILISLNLFRISRIRYSQRIEIENKISNTLFEECDTRDLDENEKKHLKSIISTLIKSYMKFPLREKELFIPHEVPPIQTIKSNIGLLSTKKALKLLKRKDLDLKDLEKVLRKTEENEQYIEAAEHEALWIEEGFEQKSPEIVEDVIITPEQIFYDAEIEETPESIEAELEISEIELLEEDVSEIDLTIEEVPHLRIRKPIIDESDPDLKIDLGAEACPHCGSKVPDTIYCIYCGKLLDEKDDEKETKQKS